jgi:hypothetical protein
MPYARLQFQPGIVKDETELASRPRWTDGDKVRFYRGLPQPIGGRELAGISTFVGRCRGLLPWSDNAGNSYCAVGTSKKLYAYYGGRLYDITPIRLAATLGTDPIATTNGSSTATVTWTTHGLSPGDYVYIHTPAGAVNNLTVGGDDATLSSPFTTVSASAAVEVTQTAHGFVTGEIVNFSGASAVGGITISGDYTITVLTADVYLIYHSAVATSSATGGGASVVARHFKSYVVQTVPTTGTFTVTGVGTANASSSGGSTTVQAKAEIGVGNDDSLGGGGFGVGGFGSGGFGLGGGAQENQARTWSLAAWGEYLLANPRYDGLYQWQLNPSQRAAVVSNAPAQIGYMFVTPERHVVCVGSTNLSSVYDPRLVRWSDQEDNTAWTASDTNQSGDFTLAIGSEGICGKASVGQNLIWTDRALYAMRYTGEGTFVFSFQPLGTECGIIGPRAFSEQDGRAFWVGQSRQFFLYDGSAPKAIDCPVRDYVFDTLSPVQDVKIYTGSNSQFTELWTFYPTGTDNLECSRYVTWNYVTGEWSIGTFDLTAWADRSGVGNPIAATDDGNLFFMESGTGDNGAAYSEVYIESSPVELGEGEPLMDVFRWVPDFKDMAVGVNFYLLTRDKPQGVETTEGPFQAGPSTEDVTMRVPARQVRVRIESLPDPATTWRLGAVQLEIQPAGGRR